MIANHWKGRVMGVGTSIHSFTLQIALTIVLGQAKASTLFQVLHMGAGSHKFGPSSVVIPVSLTSNWIGNGAAEPEVNAHVGCHHYRWQFNSLQFSLCSPSMYSEQ